MVLVEIMGVHTFPLEDKERGAWRAGLAGPQEEKAGPGPAIHFSRCSGQSAGPCATSVSGGSPPTPPLPGLWSEAPPQAGSGGLSIPTVACRAGWLGVREGGARREEWPRAFSVLSVRCCCARRGMLEGVRGRWR